MEVGLYDAGYRHLHLDDCWAAKERNATGFPYPEIDHFPNGESAPAATSAEKPSSRSFGVARQRELAPYPSPSCPFFVSFHLAHRGSPLLVAGDRGLVSSAELLRAAGMKPVIDYIHSRGLRFGICKQPCRLFPVPGAGQQPRPLNGIIDCHAAPVL
jgi:hypothetical protein